MIVVLAEDPYFYTLTRNDETDDYLLTVTCGTTAVFYITIRLTPIEIAAFHNDPEGIRTLAYRVLDKPDSFLKRRI